MTDFKPRKFEAIIDEFGKDDYGVASGTFDVHSIVNGQISYEENPAYLCPPRNHNVVIDDNGCWHHIGDARLKQLCKEINN